MAQIIRGTTPTIKFTYADITVSAITTAILTVKQNGTDIITKDLTDATIGADYISWTLTQTETLSLGKTGVVIVCDWVTTDGTRGRSNILNATIGEPGKNEVI